MAEHKRLSSVRLTLLCDPWRWTRQPWLSTVLRQFFSSHMLQLQLAQGNEIVLRLVRSTLVARPGRCGWARTNPTEPSTSEKRTSVGVRTAVSLRFERPRVLVADGWLVFSFQTCRSISLEKLGATHNRNAFNIKHDPAPNISQLYTSQ